MRQFIVTLVLCVLLAGCHLKAPVPPPRPTEELAARLDAIFSSTNATVAARVIVLPSRRELYVREADRPMIPASNMKVLTSAAALDMFGPRHQFKTELAVRGDDVCLIGGGDPGFGDARIAEWNKQKPLDHFEPFVAALKSRGVTSIKGNLFYDDSALDRELIHPSWSKGFREYWYAAPTSGLSFNDNCIDVTVHPTQAGQPVRFEVLPPTQMIKIVNNCLTGEKHAPEIKRGAGPYEYILSGTCKTTATLASKPVEDPSTFTADAFRTYLASKGITIHGKTLRAPAGATDDAEVIATHVTPIAVALKRLNKSSQNFFAEAICKATGYAYEHWRALPDQSASWKSGGDAIRNFLNNNGIDHTALVVADGSGLSRQNRVTARMMTDLLALMHRHVDAKVFYDSLPISGTDGTLRNRLKEIEGKVRAKTGSIGGVRALSGYIQSDGRTLVFSVLLNDIPNGEEDKALAKMDEAVREMAK